MLYTVGKISIYENYIRNNSNAAKRKGGSVWRNYEKAKKHCQKGFKIYGVDAIWAKDTQIDIDGCDWHKLKRNAKLLKIKPRKKENK